MREAFQTESSTTTRWGSGGLLRGQVKRSVAVYTRAHREELRSDVLASNPCVSGTEIALGVRKLARQRFRLLPVDSQFKYATETCTIGAPRPRGHGGVFMPTSSRCVGGCGITPGSNLCYKCGAAGNVAAKQTSHPVRRPTAGYSTFAAGIGVQIIA